MPAMIGSGVHPTALRWAAADAFIAWAGIARYFEKNPPLARGNAM